MSSQFKFSRALRACGPVRTASLALLFAATASAQDAPTPAPARKPPASIKAPVRRIPPAAAPVIAPTPVAPAAAAPAATPATNPTDKDPPGAAGALPTTMEKIATAADVPFRPQPGGHLVKFNLQDADLAELVNHISGLTGKRFIYGAKVRQIKATVVSPEPVSLEEAYQAFLSILDANGMTVVPHGRFLKIVDSGGVVTQPTPVIARGEPVPDSDRFVTRLYRLEHVGTEEAMALLGKFKSKDGDISVYTPGKLLIVTDTATQVRRLMRIVEEIDVGGSGQHMWIEPVRNGTAQELAKRVNELFELGTPPPAGSPPGSGKGGGLNKVIADEQTNSLIVVGTEDSYLRLLEVLKRLDSQTSTSGKIHVLPLQHAIAEEMSQTLNQMLGAAAGRGAAPPAGAPGGAAQGTFEGELKITADKSTNSLIITSSNRDYATMRLVIDKLDHSRRQVFIEAVIMDLLVSDSTTLGVSFHGGTPLGAAQDSLLLGGFNAGKSVAFPADPSLLQGFAAGIRGPAIPNTTNLLGTGLSIPAFGVVLNAVASSGRSNILSTPHIIATDNVEAAISIGENIPLQTNVGGGGAAAASGAAGAAVGLGLLNGLGGFAAPRQDVGNKIKLTPHINESNQVRLEIDQESSAPGATSGTLGAVSIIKRTANTTVVVQDQQTVVIGGLMSDEYTTTRTKVPVLGDLPLLGALFRTSDVQKRKKNLLLVLTPHVIRDQDDLRKIFERKMQERQEFLDRYMVFSGTDWQPPRDWSRTSGLVEDVRKAYMEIAEQERIESESKPKELPPREPSDPIELPGDVHGVGVAATPAPAPAENNRRIRAPGAPNPAALRTPAQPAPAAPAAAPPAAPAVPAPAAPAPAVPTPAVPVPAPGTPGAQPPAAAPQGQNGPAFRINPIARSVNVDRVE
ncbi:MAG TPA: type II secretion system secretin GspD [Polyangiaceae bacterium]|nr:type II secretion system secretin GspD [Polyangiaceae bacterium]